MVTKKGFLSYSHSDREFAERLAHALVDKGLDVWFDAWEIFAGDSIVEKVFEHGLKDCEFFLIVLSADSVKSKWVRHELDSAMVRRLEGLTRVIPVVKEKCQIPVALRTLRWADLSQDFDAGVEEIARSVFAVSSRPTLGQVPAYVTELTEGIGGLSKLASAIGLALVHSGDHERGNEVHYEGPELNALVEFLDPQQVNDGVDELEEYGLVKLTKWMGTAPYDFGSLSPTYALFLHFEDKCDYAPQEDIRAVASAVAATQSCDGRALQDATGLSPLRLNRAVRFLGDYGYLRVTRWMSTTPYDFGQVDAIRRTREFVETHCA